ncbi:MAG: cation transporter [Verrucomicrobiae bacterium]|nr:cation transporter [Verrucomicrobiae bacterium]
MRRCTSICPSCGENGREVKKLTLRSLLSEDGQLRIQDSDYRFCGSGDCEVVYFAEDASTPFTKADLTVRVGIKEAAAPRHVCYCFDHTIEEIEDDIQRTGETAVLGDIKTRMKEACWCETKSPMGSCCLATVNRHIKAAKERLSPSSDSSNDDDDADCCAVPAQINDAPAVPATQDHARKAGRFAMAGGMLSAIAASACCRLPLLLISLGVSGAAVGAVFERFRPLLLLVAFTLLGVAFYFAYRKRRTDDCCANTDAKTSRVRSLNRAMLWGVTAITLSFALFPNYIGVLAASKAPDEMPAHYHTRAFVVEGMTCEACAVTLEQQIGQLGGVDMVKVDFATGKAMVGSATARHLASDAVILNAISTAGYRGTVNELPNPTLSD